MKLTIRRSPISADVEPDTIQKIYQKQPLNESQFSTQSNFYRVGRSLNTKREAATPIFSIRKGYSPNFNQNHQNRISTFEKSQDSTEEFRADYEALKKSYQRLVEENISLRSDKSLIFGENSVSTVALDRENEQQIQNYALETEDLYEMISDAHQSIQDLLENCSDIHQEFTEIKRQHNHLKFTQDLQEYTKSVKINLLQETLNKKIEEIKMMTRDKKRVEIAFKETESTRREVEGDIRVKEARLKTLEPTCDPDVLNLAEMYYKMTLAASNLALSEKKVAKYEKYIQANFKDKHS
ncbi:hypothetical protein SteCoe_29441 [Stentor coeruleus]|uniref:Uncharacterized protein n=1 Tax=Stentor coeruleus TaxID=5963 RepID=A0A1R2B675_9CILI|nr:hypothetical protein SteCoe_29441 [Stentor coeruleus]